jgi:hypothetical protein
MIWSFCRFLVVLFSVCFLVVLVFLSGYDLFLYVFFVRRLFVIVFSGRSGLTEPPLGLIEIYRIL